MIFDFKRYVKNTNSFSREEIEHMHSKKICVIGAGGLGGYVIQTLARFGILNITVVDKDVFDVTNLNRQLFCKESNLGQYKAVTCAKELKNINSSVNVTAIVETVDEDTVDEIVKGHDLVLDCLDDINTRFIVEGSCAKYGKVMIHGAIGGFFGQAAVIFPGDYSLKKIYKDNSQGIEKKLGVPSFTPVFVSAVQCSETIKVLLNKGDILRHRLLFMDLLHNDFEIIELS